MINANVKDTKTSAAEAAIRILSFYFLATVFNGIQQHKIQ